MNSATTENSITHIEIRRVQNGFVVMAMNFNQRPYAYDYGRMQENVAERASFVANSSAELGTLVQALADGMQLNWLPTVDLPLLEMRYWVQAELARVNRLLEKKESPG